VRIRAKVPLVLSKQNKKNTNERERETKTNKKKTLEEVLIGKLRGEKIKSHFVLKL